MAQNNNMFNRNPNENPPAQVQIQGEEAILNPTHPAEEGKPQERKVKLPKSIWQ